LVRGDIDIDPNDDQLPKQLGDIKWKLKWKLTSKGQIAVESRTRCASVGCHHLTGLTPWRTPSHMLIFRPSMSRVMPAKASPETR
jgi:hypothetical protein